MSGELLSGMKHMFNTQNLNSESVLMNANSFLGPKGDPAKPFSLNTNSSVASVTNERLPSFMDVAGQTSNVSQESNIRGNVDQLQERLKEAQTILKDRRLDNAFTNDNYSALQEMAGSIDRELKEIARLNKNKDTEKNKLKIGKAGQPDAAEAEVDPSGLLSALIDWIDGGQETLASVLNNIGHEEQGAGLDTALKTQYAIQRAVQKTEMFVSVMGSLVSGIKTIMSTQLG